MRGRKALVTVAALAILVWPLRAAPPSEPLAASLQSPGTTTRVSVDSDGTQGDEGSYSPSISADGRYVAFESDATNLVPGDPSAWLHIFVRDRQTSQTTRVSVASDGTQGNLSSDYPSISADGRYVAFASWATSLVPSDTNGARHIFVHNPQTGQSERVSLSSSGEEGNARSQQRKGGSHE